MMHIAFRKRLDALEEARRRQSRPPHVISVCFPPAESSVALADGFRCHRLPAESTEAFKSRAHAAYCAIDPKRRIQILIFEPSPQMLLLAAPGPARTGERCNCCGMTTS
jgi:hypothetical protein